MVYSPSFNTLPTLTAMLIESQISEVGYRFLPDWYNEKLFGEGCTPDIGHLIKRRILASFEKFGLTLEPQENRTQEFPDLDEWLDGSPEETLDNALEPFIEIQYQINEFLDKMDSLVNVPGYSLNPNMVPSLRTIKTNLRSGWIRYGFDGSVTPVECPQENVGIYDVETFVKYRNMPLMASFLSTEAIYLWLHPALLGESNFSGSNPTLVNLGSNKVILNYNTLFDANKTKESYEFTTDLNVTWVDLMSMHIATHGASREQKAVLSMKDTRFAFRWKEHTTKDNTLVSAYNFHTGGMLTDTDKELRGIFVTATSIEVIKANLIDLIRYNILDTLYTAQLAIKLWPKYIFHNPHPVTFAGHVILGSTLLPVVSDWDRWVERVELTFHEFNQSLDQGLSLLADTLRKTGSETSDFWASQLDWTPLKSGKNKGVPKWYANARKKPITTKSNLAPLLLKMSWNGKPLYYDKKLKWCYVVCDSPEAFYKLSEESSEGKNHLEGSVQVSHIITGKNLWIKKVPHPKGEASNCGSPLAKDYIRFLENNTLSSEDPSALEYLKKAKAVSYWSSMRSRVKEFVPIDSNLGCKAIKPYLVPHGTVTRRSVEPTWLTCSDVKPNIVGSELRSRIQAPKGYRFVGADFDAQELKIGHLGADSAMGHIGSSPMGLINMLGDKDKGTDGHSLLAKDLQVERQLAKTLNFLMLFFGGQKGLFEAIKANRLDLPDSEAKSIANKGLKSRRGTKDRNTGFYKDGTDSQAYNWMIKQANTPENRTILSRSAISRNLWKDVVKDEFMPSRCNRNIQSTGVDILHVFLSLFRYFIKKRNLEAYFVISIHDEIWVMSKDSHVDEVVKVFQVCHLLTWVMVCKAFGFESIPFDFCFFSAVNVDYVIRKEVSNNTDKEGNYIGLQTPSNTKTEVEKGYYVKPKDMVF